jgi:hypothetical protein
VASATRLEGPLTSVVSFEISFIVLKYRSQFLISGDYRLLGLIQRDKILKEEGPGFVGGMQTRDRGSEIQAGLEKIRFCFLD